MTPLTIGYVPLSDAAVLIAAAERGFAAAAGFDLVLVREASWASIRDKLVFGYFDAAHMLAPLAVATTLGLGHVAMPLAAPFVLNLGGNAVTISCALAEALRSRGGLSWRARDGRCSFGRDRPHARFGRASAAHFRHRVSVLHPQLSAASSARRSRP